MAIWLNYTRDLGPTSNLDGYGSDVPNGGNPYGNQMLGIVNHSAEGYFGTGNPSSVMRARGNSWHFTVLKNGKVWQHYPLEGMCWHAGSKANYRYIGIEHEGKAGEALTSAQLAATIKLNAAIARVRGWTSVKYGVTGFEHNDFMATACPSGRIPWSTIEAGTKVAAPTGIWGDVKQVSLSVTLQKDTYLVKLPDKTAVKLLIKGTKLSVKGVWKGIYYITPYSFDNKIPNGFAVSATIVAPDPVDPCKDVKAQLVAAHAEIASLKATLIARNKTIATLKTTLLARDKTITILTTKNASLTARLDEVLRSAGESLRVANEAIQALQEQVIQLEKDAAIGIVIREQHDKMHL